MIREIVVSDASLQATMLACIKSVPVRCGISLAAWTTREEAQQFTTIQGQLVPNQGLQPKPKSRAKETACSPAVAALGIRVHPNMRVPESSITAKAFLDPWQSTYIGIENFESWDTSSEGNIGHGPVEIEAYRSGEKVSAIMRLAPSPETQHS